MAVTFRKLLRTVVLVVVTAIVSVACWWGWLYVTELSCTSIEIQGNRYATSSEVMRLAGVDTGKVLFEIESRLVEDRVQRHPWVAEAHVSRLPTGMLTIQVEEREPVARVVGRDGRASWYLDAYGYPMPVVRGSAFNVPLLRCHRETLHPVRSVEDSTLRALLLVLADLDDRTDAIISEIEIRANSEIRLKTTPSDVHETVDVRLGRDGIKEKMETLIAFWDQIVLVQKQQNIQYIDLRFDSQVVTRENVWVN